MLNRIVLLVFFCFCFCLSPGQEKGYYRTPCLYKNTLVFTAEGDLWKFDLNTKLSTRLTTNSGLEENPAISPDGKLVAFSGQYEGVSELYLIGINGGIPKRLTYEFNGETLNISGWTKEGEILYRTGANNALPTPQMVKINPITLKKENIPLWQASMGCYDDLGVLYFTRFPNQGSKTKRYQGGLIEQIWKFDGKTEAINLTADFKGTSTKPMYYKDRIYFLSDRDGTMNIWSMDKQGKSLEQSTFSKGFDLQSASIYESHIVFQKGADIGIYDIPAKTTQILDIKLTSDLEQRKTKWIKSPKESITFSDISPNGKYLAIVSRGRVFVSPTKGDRWVEIIHQSGIRAKDVHFINDKSLAILSDQNGEYEVFKVNADGSDSPQQITRNSKTIITDFKVSPDGKFIAYHDKNNVLRISETATGETRFKYGEAYGGISEISWSPNSLLLMITQSIENMNNQIGVVDIRNMKLLPITSANLNSYSPAWTADGKWLYFLSERNLVTKIRAPWGPRQPEPYYTQTTGIYALPTDSLEKFPFLSVDSWIADSVFTPNETSKKLNKTSRNKTKGIAPIQLNYNWSFSKSRIYKVPLKSGNIRSCAIINGYLYWLDSGPDGEENAGKIFALKIAESKKYEPIEIASSVTGFDIATEGKKVLVTFSNHNLAVIEANGEKLDLEKTKVELNNWAFSVDPQKDWQEMFNDAWRMMRDYFYDRNLHKVDWVSVKARYEPLVSRITDRYELDDLLSQMVGELSALHTFVYGGEKRNSQDNIQVGFLGARLTKVKEGFRIDHIYKSDPDFDFSSPLEKPELIIKVGDIISAIDNFSLENINDVGELLANKVGVPVKLRILRVSQKVRDQVVIPFSARDAEKLRYNEWEYHSRQKVDSASNNEIGYIHLKAMGSNDMDDFVKQYYPIFNRKGLILDVRENFGGNIDSWVLEKLLRKAWMYWQGRAGGQFWNMPYAFLGHMVIVCDQQTASDGEAICEGFRRLGLGKVIGMRSWGGEIWLSQDNKMVDNGIATAAELGVYSPEGKWLIEGYGVEPDIAVDNLPFETYKGKDAQLEKAINYLKTEISEHPVNVPPVPPHPDKSFKYAE